MDRSGNQAEARFTEWVEAVRVGTIFAQDQKQYERWRRRTPGRSSSEPLTGAGLDRHVANLRRERPDLVRMNA